MNANHAHVNSLCRHCLDSETMTVEPSFEKANEFMHNLPQEFERMADELPTDMAREIEILRDVSIRRYEEDIYRVRIGDHDLIIVSTECHEEFGPCKESFRKYQMMKIMEQRAREVLENIIGSDVLENLFGPKEPKEDKPQEQEQPDKSYNILNQLDLPEDFFKQGPSH